MLSFTFFNPNNPFVRYNTVMYDMVIGNAFCISQLINKILRLLFSSSMTKTIRDFYKKKTVSFLKNTKLKICITDQPDNKK